MTDSTPILTDFTTLAFLIAHGADADLDTREMDVLADRAEMLAQTLYGSRLAASELAEVMQGAVQAYSELAVVDTNAILDRLGRALDAEQRAEVYGAFVAVAAADGSMHTMEQTLLRHIAAAWRLD